MSRPFVTAVAAKMNTPLRKPIPSSRLTTSMTRWRSDQNLLHTFKERRLIDTQNIAHLPRMPRCKLPRPQMRPAQVRPIKRRVNIRVRLHLTRDQIRKRHNSRSRLVPQRQRDVVTLHQPRISIVATGRDTIEHALRQVLLIRHVPGDGDGLERRRDGNVGGFGIDEEIDVGANVLG